MHPLEGRSSICEYCNLICVHIQHSILYQLRLFLKISCPYLLLSKQKNPGEQRCSIRKQFLTLMKKQPRKSSRQHLSAVGTVDYTNCCWMGKERNSAKGMWQGRRAVRKKKSFFACILDWLTYLENNYRSCNP